MIQRRFGFLLPNFLPIFLASVMVPDRLTLIGPRKRVKPKPIANYSHTTRMDPKADAKHKLSYAAV